VDFYDFYGYTFIQVKRYSRFVWIASVINNLIFLWIWNFYIFKYVVTKHVFFVFWTCM